MQNITDIPKNILIIQQRQLGDVVVTSPVFEAVKKAFPHAKLTLLTEKKCVPLAEKDIHLDEIIPFPKNENIFSQIKFYWNLHRKNFDVVADMQQLPRCQMAVLCSGAKYRLSFAPRHAYKKMLYTHCFVPENTEHDYTSYSKIRILSPLGIEPTEQKPRLYLTEEERRKAREILASLHIEENTPFITLDATHKHPKRRWKYYGELVRRILADYPQFVFFVIRAPNEDEQVRHLLDIDPERVRMPANPLSLRDTMACMSFASFHIGNTSAPEHMALALNIPALVILSETASFWHFAPKNPLKGTAKQMEVRLSEEEYQWYLKNLREFQKGNKPDFVPEEYPLINCISVEKAMEKFKFLLSGPFYE